MITRAKAPIEARAFAVLNDFGEALVALASISGRLEQILELGGPHILVEGFKSAQRTEGEQTNV